MLNNTHFEKTTKLSFDDVFDKSSISLLEPGQGSSKISQLKKSIFELAKELAQTDNNMHVNSSAFKEMKKSLSSLGKSLNAYSPLNLDSLYQVSQDLENLHNASLNYIQKKGIGNQSTDLGKSRMMLALNIANNTFDFIDNFPTKEEMIRYEKEQLLHNDVEAEFDEFDNSF